MIAANRGKWLSSRRLSQALPYCTRSKKKENDLEVTRTFYCSLVGELIYKGANVCRADLRGYLSFPSQPPQHPRLSWSEKSKGATYFDHIPGDTSHHTITLAWHSLIMLCHGTLWHNRHNCKHFGFNHCKVHNTVISRITVRYQRWYETNGINDGMVWYGMQQERRAEMHHVTISEYFHASE